MSNPTHPATIAIIDDHQLVRHALIELIQSFGEYRVVFHGANGQDLIDQMSCMEKPDLIFLDISMPVMNGHDTLEWLYENHPEIATIILSGHDSELNQIRLLQFGARGFVRKDAPPHEIKLAIQTALSSDYFYANATTSRFIKMLRNPDSGKDALKKKLLTETEYRFLKLICTEMTYKAIAREMGLNPRTIDTLRDQLFIKMDVKSRVALAVVALRNGIVNLFDDKLLKYG